MNLRIRLAAKVVCKTLPVLFSVFLMLSLPVNAQHTDGYCGAELSAEQREWLHNFQQDAQSELLESQRGADYYVPVKVHILGDDNGNGYYRLEYLFETMCDLNARFDSTGFLFYIAGDINYIDNGDWYEHDFWGGSSMMILNNVPNAMNIYFVADPAGNCGYFAPGPDAIAVAKSCAQPGETTVAHEVGHYFSLPHTFSGWEGGDPPPISQQERVDGANCNSAGDGFCDTPPDYAYYRWNCPSVGPFIDPVGVSFVPDGRYYMSYSNDACTDRFSPLQRQAMRSYLQGPRNDLLVPPVPPEAALDTAVALLPQFDAVDVPYNYTVLNWAEVEGADYYHVVIGLNSILTAVVEEAIVSDTFFIADLLDSERKYYWKVKPIAAANTCTPYSEVMRFTTGTWATGIQDGQTPISAVSLFPNPLGSGEILQVDLQSEAPFEGVLRVLGLDGRERYRSAQQVSVGVNRIQIPSADWSSGLYILSVEGDGFRAEEKFLITR